MKLTPDQRRQRLYDLMHDDPNFMQMYSVYIPAREWFLKVTARLPRRLRDRLREYPGMMFFMHRRMLDAVCRHMQFQDED